MLHDGQREVFHNQSVVWLQPSGAVPTVGFMPFIADVGASPNQEDMRMKCVDMCRHVCTVCTLHEQTQLLLRYLQAILSRPFEFLFRSIAIKGHTAYDACEIVILCRCIQE
jgi:hypothetical protein